MLIKEIIVEEILKFLNEETIEESWKSKLQKFLAGATLAGGMGLTPAQAAPSGQMTSTETPITQTSRVESASASKIVKILKQNGIKDISAPEVNEIGRLADKVWRLRAKKGVSSDDWLQKLGDWFATQIKLNGKDEAIKDVEEYLKNKMPPERTVTQSTFINHRAVVQNALNGIGAALLSSGDVGAAIGKFADAVKAAYKGGDLSKEEVRKISNIMQDDTTMSSKLEKINKILK